jgi:hypothetical protein
MLRRLSALIPALALCAGLTGCQTATVPAPAMPATPALTVSDVRDMLASMEAADPTADYRVDVRAFAASVEGQLTLYVDSANPEVPFSAFRVPDSTSQTALDAGVASARISEALAVYDRIARAQGAQAADAAMMSAGWASAESSVTVGDQALLCLLQEGANRLTFMFGAPDTTMWTWKVTSVSVSGADTADVAYEVAAPKGKAFRFTRSSFTKRLHFARRADGVWVLDGWLDYPAFESAVRGSIEPQDEIPNLVPNWWDSLGAE